ncbi:hypothetical protein PVAP13_9NG120073, partial [Panicum virgatum]
MTTVLGYRLLSPNLRVYWLLPGKNLSDGLHIVDCDDDTIVMNQVAHRFNSFVLYFDHHNHVGKNSYKDDIVLNQINTLPKTLSPRKVPKMVGAQLSHFYQNIHRVNSQASGAGNEGDGEGIDDDSEDSDFMDSDNDIEDEDDDLFFDNVDDTVADKGAAHDWDDISTDEDELQLPESDEEGEVGRNMISFTPEDMSNPIFKIGMKF